MSDLNIPNLDKLIAHLEAQPPERFNMGWPRFDYHPCGTAACISGHIQEIFDVFGSDQAAATLGLSKDEEWALFMPNDWDAEKQNVTRYPLHRAIATLKRLRDHYLATGEIVVDWGPEPTAGEPWAAPQATELTPPVLPAEITRLLAPETSALTPSEA